MLTVMFRDVYGDEYLYEAQSVRRVVRSDSGLPRDERAPGPGVLVNFAEGVSTHIGEVNCRQDGDVNPEVFVMNSEGQTVARYKL